MASSSSSLPRWWSYDVFLSFRGEDTREGFTSHLYSALSRAGIFTFIDNQLGIGQRISSELLIKIEQSRFAIVVFSVNYASSSWCLDELDKIMECKKKMGHDVIPIFYNVEPSEFRNMRGRTAEHMMKHRETFGSDSENIERWRIALKDTANLTGWHIVKGQRTSEAASILEIVKEVSRRLSQASLSVANYPVGINDYIERIDPILRIGMDDEVRMIGIYGDDGIGKSTIARAILNYHGHKFDGISFLEHVGARSGVHGHKLVQVQETLLFEILGDDSIRLGNSSRGVCVISQRLRLKKVLVVIDDVSNLDQLRQLAGSNEWFGSGSRIIITTDDRDLLRQHGVEHLYKVDGLNEFYSAQLLCWNAFRKPEPPDQMFAKLLSMIVGFVEGLPQALIMIGSSLYGKSVEEWESIVTSLLGSVARDEEWPEVLKITADGLEQFDEAVFLAIACFVNGRDKEKVRRFLKISESLFQAAIEELTNRSLVSVWHNRVWVHESLRQLVRLTFRRSSLLQSRWIRTLQTLEVDELELDDDINEAIISLNTEISEGTDDTIEEESGEEEDGNDNAEEYVPDEVPEDATEEDVGESDTTDSDDSGGFASWLDIILSF